MSLERVLPAVPLARPDDAPYGGNGSGLDAARKLGPTAVIEDLTAAGLRGRGGAGFPTATKWLAALRGRSDELPTTVVVNAAEGEPGSYKDRSLLQRNPYGVIEGALHRLLPAGHVALEGGHLLGTHGDDTRDD